MTGASLIWVAWFAIALVLEAAGILHLRVLGVTLEPLTIVVRREMGRSTAFVGAVAAFILWLAFHFLVQTYLPRRFGKRWRRR